MRSTTSQLLALVLLTAPALGALTAAPAQAVPPGAQSMLTAPRSDSVRTLTSVHVSLDDPGGVTPDAVPGGSTLGTVGAVIVWWEAADGHGLEVNDYLLERQLVGASTWQTVVNTGGARSYVDRTVDEGSSYRYRVTAHNSAGYGPDTMVGASAGPNAERALVVAGRTLASGPTGLYQVDPDRPDAPPVALTSDARDYSSPAVSPAGSRLAFSRSTGDGSDGQYDLWSGTPTAPATRRLTSMDGVETDAAYSPDASQIAFTHSDGAGTSVWVVNALGGTPRKLRGDASSPAWATDGRSVFVQDDSVQNAPLLSIAVATTAATAVPYSEGGYEPAVSRTGRLAWISGDGEVLFVDPGETYPMVAVNAPARNYFTGLAYDDLGKLYYDEIDVQTHEPVDHRSDLLTYGADPAPLRSDRTTPDLTVGTVTDLVRGSVTVNVAATDHDETPTDALAPQCRLDSASFTSCKGLVPLTRLTEGHHTFSVRVSDESGHTSTAERGFVSDTVGPRIILAAPTQANVTRGLGAFTWAATDAGSGVAGHEVRISTSTPYSAARPYTVPAGLGSTTSARSLTIRPALGQTVCLRLRSVDRSGLWSSYTTKCAIRPLDDRSLRASAGWKRVYLASGLQRTVSTVARKKATLSTTSAASVRRVGVLGVSCPRCGAVRVYVGGAYVGQVSFRGATAVRLVNLPVFARTRWGAVSLRTTSRKAVRIDGLLLSKS